VYEAFSVMPPAAFEGGRRLSVGSQTRSKIALVETSQVMHTHIA